MAKLLYSLGLFSAKRAWIVLGSWFVILSIAVTWMIGAGGKLTTATSVDGIESQQVIDELKTSFPDASRGQAGLVFHNVSGENFTPDQVASLNSLFTKAESLDSIDEVLNPFITADLIAQNNTDLADGKKALADAQAELNLNQAKLDEGFAALTEGQKTLDEQLAGLQGNISYLNEIGAPPAQIAMAEAGLDEIAAAQQAIDSNRAELEAGQSALDDGRLTLEQSKLDLAAGERLLAATEGFSTVSVDGSTAVATVFFNKPGADIETADRQSVMNLFLDNPVAGVQVEFSAELASDFGALLGIGEIVGLLIAGLTLLLMLGTLIGAGLPLISAILGVGISASITMALSAFYEMSSTTPLLGVMLGLAVGIDYSLFLVNRHRRQLKMGMEIRESIGLANGTSGNAVVFAGLTVVIALAALNITGIGFLGLMGTMGAMAIVFAVLIAITLTPALLSLIGLKILSKKDRAKLNDAAALEEAKEPHNAHKPIFATRHPWVSVLASILVLGIVAIPAASLRLGLPDGSSEPEDSTQYRSYKLISENFGPGVNGQVIAVVGAKEKLEGNDLLNFQADLSEIFRGLDNVAYAIPAGVSDSGTQLLFQVVPTGGPASQETTEVVNDLRALAPELEEKYSADLGVTGLAASNIDISAKLASVLPIYLGAVILLSMFLLLLVFRSIALPIVASAGFLLTILATLGVVTAVFQWGWLGDLLGVHDPGPVLNFLPTLLIGIVFGLAMDYQLFLASGIREAYVHGMKPKDAINFGVHMSRSVVIAAAIIMISVFGSFMFSHVTLVRPMGLGLAAGVLLDAFIVRLILVPAVLSLLGDKAWWIPKWLDRLLPDVDVEGAKLEGSMHAK